MNQGSSHMGTEPLQQRRAVEFELTGHMVRRGLWLTPVVVLVSVVIGGLEAFPGAVLGIALALANLWFGGWVLGGLAENRPDLLLPGAIVVLAVAFGATIGALTALKQVDFIAFPMTAIIFAGSHLTLVTWEAADRFLKPQRTPREKHG
jgi:ABC-type proline/glycine betaine transport system permease subunit